jgi:hypothetical protein
VNLQSYIDLGWSVIPVKGPAYSKDYDDSKSPLVDWAPYQKRKPTPEEVAEWIAKTPNSSVGVITGPINGIFVVDIDGNDWVKALPNADFGITWKTVSKRGCHYFYQWEDWMKDYPTTKSKVGKIKGFDTRGIGGYVVAPNGNESLRSWQIPYTEPLAVMPDWLRVFLRENLNRKEQGTPFELSAISEANRHTPYVSLIGKLLYAKMNPAEIIQIITPMVEKTGLGEDPVKLVMDLATRYPKEQTTELKLESMEALLSENQPPLDWMIEGLWVDNAKGFIAGHPGTGKTWIALDMMLSVATGGLCMGKYKPAYKAPCLIIEEEASRRNLQRRIHDMARARQLKPSDVSTMFHITQQFSSIPRDAEQITDIILKNGIRFVVFDSLREVHSAKENSSDEMAVVLRAFKQISVVGRCSVLLIHHMSKSGADSAGKSIFERMRGTGSLWAWRDCVLAIEGEEESTVCKCTFQFRDAESPSPVKITRHIGVKTGAIGLEAVALDESEDFMEKTAEILAFVKSHLGGVSRNQIFKEIGGYRNQVLATIKRMEKLRLLAKEGSKLVVLN